MTVLDGVPGMTDISVVPSVTPARAHFKSFHDHTGLCGAQNFTRIVLATRKA